MKAREKKGEGTENWRFRERREMSRFGIVVIMQMKMRYL